MDNNHYEELVLSPPSSNSGQSEDDYLKSTVNTNIPESTSHLLQLFVFNSNEADCLFLHGYIEHFFQFQRIKQAIPLFLSSIDYTNAYMLNLCRQEFPHFTKAFSDFIDLNHTRILFDISTTAAGHNSNNSGTSNRPSINSDIHQSRKGAARYVNFQAQLNPEEFLKKKYRWIKRFLDWIDVFSVEVFDNFDVDNDKSKPKRQVVSVKWLKKNFALSCSFLKAEDKLLFSLPDDRPLEAHTRYFLDNHQIALESAAVTWKENDSFVFKVTLRLCLSTYFSFLNDSTW